MFSTTFKFLCLFALTLLFPILVNAQNADSIRSLVEKHYAKFPEEKIYLHLDKPNYSPGDTIWFKAYAVEGSTNLPDTVSKNIYVDLYKKDNEKPIGVRLLKNETGSANGFFKLKDSLAEGTYEIRAYTNWMRNFPSENFYHRAFLVKKKFSSQIQFTKEEFASWNEIADLQFFPEGGNLIVGLQTRVAFKAVNKWGKGVEVKAFLVSSSNDTVASILSQHLGMGNFVLKPKSGEKYFVVFGKSPSEKKFFLPEALPQGYTFFVDNLTNKDQIKIMARNNFTSKDRPILVCHQRGTVVFAAQSSTEGNSFSWMLPKVDLRDDGIIHVTLFDGSGKPVCERLVFNDLQSPTNIEIKADKNEYRTFEKVTLSVQVKDDDGSPVKGDFSASITDMEQVPPSVDGENINNYLYLTSDIHSRGEIKGEIEHPDYYFNRANLNAKVHLDMLLMTQGWRKFLWSDVLNNQTGILPYQLETGISLSGKAVSMTKKNADKPIEISMMHHKKKGVEYITETTDENGKFVFRNLNISAQEKIFLQATKENGKRNITISIDEPTSPKFYPQKDQMENVPFNADNINLAIDKQKYYAELEEKFSLTKSKLLKEVVVKAQREYKTDSRKSFYDGTNMTTLNVGAENRCGTASNILQLMQGRVAGAQVKMESDGTYSVYLTRTGTKATILVDGFIYDTQTLQTIQPCTVESIDVITHPVVTLNAPGVVSILTKRFNPDYDWSKEKWIGAAVANVRGYDVPRQFYSPKYSADDVGKGQDSKLDFRSTLYWNPSITTDSEGNAKITFWTSGEKSPLHVDFQGISTEGKPAATKFKVDVN
ncbi:MAG: hypothetical protein QM734_05275 [Cyclobacteriaceae bacterium]